MTEGVSDSEAGSGVRWTPSCSEDLSSWLPKHMPSETETGPSGDGWIWVQSSKAQLSANYGRPNPDARKQLIHEARRKVEDAVKDLDRIKADSTIPVRASKVLGKSKKYHRDQVQDRLRTELMQLGSQSEYGQSGKWMLFAQQDAVDSIFAKLAMSVVSGTLFHLEGPIVTMIKVESADAEPGFSKGGYSRLASKDERRFLICVYFESVWKSSHAATVLESIIGDHGETPTGCKPDLYTDAGIMSKHPSGIRSTLYQPSELLSKAQMDLLRAKWKKQKRAAEGGEGGVVSAKDPKVDCRDDLAKVREAPLQEAQTEMARLTEDSQARDTDLGTKAVESGSNADGPLDQTATGHGDDQPPRAIQKETVVDPDETQQEAEEQGKETEKQDGALQASSAETEAHKAGEVDAIKEEAAKDSSNQPPMASKSDAVEAGPAQEIDLGALVELDKLADAEATSDVAAPPKVAEKPGAAQDAQPASTSQTAGIDIAREDPDGSKSEEETVLNLRPAQVAGTAQNQDAPAAVNADVVEAEVKAEAAALVETALPELQNDPIQAVTDGGTLQTSSKSTEANKEIEAPSSTERLPAIESSTDAAAVTSLTSDPISQAVCEAGQVISEVPRKRPTPTSEDQSEEAAMQKGDDAVEDDDAYPEREEDDVIDVAKKKQRISEGGAAAVGEAAKEQDKGDSPS